MAIRENAFINNTTYTKTNGLGAGISEELDPMVCYNIRSWGFTTMRILYKFDKIDYSFRTLDEITRAPIDGTMTVHVCDTPDNIENFINHPDVFVTEINYNGKTNKHRIGAYDYISGGWYAHSDGANWVNKNYINQRRCVDYKPYPTPEEADIFAQIDFTNRYRKKYLDNTNPMPEFIINPDEDFYLITFRTHDELIYLAVKAEYNPFQNILESNCPFMKCNDILEFINLIKNNQKNLEKYLEK